MVSVGTSCKERLMQNMRILNYLASKYEHSRPLMGKTVLVCTHTTTATAQLITAIVQIGANIIFVPIQYSNDESVLKYISNISNVKIMKPNFDLRKIMPNVDVIFEDGMRISELIYKHPDQYGLKKRLYSIEQTTNGIRSFESVVKHGLLYPVLNVAESEIKLEVENSIATLESVLALLVANGSCALSHKNILVLGYGSIGRGISTTCRAHGAVVTVVETNPIKRVLASSHGYTAIDMLDMNGFLKEQDIVISCTSNHAGFCLGPEQLMLMKDGVKIINAGSGMGKISLDVINPEAYAKNRATASITKKDGRTTCVLEKMDMKKTIEIMCSATPLNLGCGNGMADEIMDFVFSLVLVILVNIDGANITRTINPVDRSLELQVAAAWLPDVYRVKPNHIKHNDLVSEDRPWGRLSRFFSNEDFVNLSRFSMVRASFGPGTSTDGHYHVVSEEAYFVESGTADILTWDPKNPDTTHETFKINPGDYLSIPRGHAHRVYVDSVEKFTCLVIASPPFSFWDQFFPTVHPISA